jgi:hypothetical protein
VADDVIESEGRQWLRDHQGRAFCARCVARELPADAPLIRAALEGLATRQICSCGPCACETVGLSCGWSVGRLDEPA